MTSPTRPIAGDPDKTFERANDSVPGGGRRPELDYDSRVITFETAQGVKPHAVKMLLSKYPEFSGLGITRVGDGWGFKVNLTRRPARRLPAKVKGVPLLAEVTGDIVAQ